MDLQIRPVDKLFYDEHLGYLPPKMIDIHTHVWLGAHRQPSTVARRGPTWPGRVAPENPIADLLETYRLMFPRQTVTPVIFGPATQEYDLDASNQYVSQAAAQHGLPSFLVTTPAWTAQELEARVVGGGFLGSETLPGMGAAPHPVGRHHDLRLPAAASPRSGGRARLDRHAAHPAPRPAARSAQPGDDAGDRAPLPQRPLGHRAHRPRLLPGGRGGRVRGPQGRAAHALRLLRQHERLCDGAPAAGGRAAARGVRQRSAGRAHADAAHLRGWILRQPGAAWPLRRRQRRPAHA